MEEDRRQKRYVLHSRTPQGPRKTAVVPYAQTLDGLQSLTDQLHALGEMMGELSTMKHSTKELWMKKTFPILKRRLKLKFGIDPPTMQTQIFNKNNEKGWNLYGILLRQHRDYWELENMETEGYDLEKIIGNRNPREMKIKILAEGPGLPSTYHLSKESGDLNLRLPVWAREGQLPSNSPDFANPEITRKYVKALPVNHIVVLDICSNKNLPVHIEAMDEAATLLMIKKLAYLERQILFICATKKFRPQIKLAYNLYQNEFKDSSSFRRVYVGLLSPIWKSIPFLQLRQMLLALFDQNPQLQLSLVHVWTLLKANRVILDGF